MKSEHRHDLKSNDLAKSLITFQDYVKVYGGRVALGVAIVILAIVLLVQRSSKARTRAAEIENLLAFARGQIDRLNHHTVKPGDLSTLRKTLQDIRDEASDKNVQAQALVALGDYAWAMANYPDLPAAATEPSMQPGDRGALLKEGKDAYQQVLDQYSDQTLSALAARFGLGAIAENQLNWDDAKKQYEAVKANGDAPESYKHWAELRLKRVEELKQPVLIGEVPEKFEPPVIPPTPPAATTTAPTPTTTATAPATTKPAPTTGLIKTGNGMTHIPPAATTKVAAPATRPTTATATTAPKPAK